MSQFHEDPYKQFEEWFALAKEKQEHNYNSMWLATVDSEGRPNNRTVLLKKMIDGKFCFFTNYESDKGQDLAKNPNVCAVFYWNPPVDYQVRIRGKAEKLTSKQSQDYFNTRPIESRLGAWASPQSQVISGLEELEQKLQEVEKKFAGMPHPPCPAFWGGYGIVPDEFEFMILQKARLHHRVRYTRAGDAWKMHWIAP